MNYDSWGKQWDSAKPCPDDGICECGKFDVLSQDYWMHIVGFSAGVNSCFGVLVFQCPACSTLFWDPVEEGVAQTLMTIEGLWPVQQCVAAT